MAYCDTDDLLLGPLTGTLPSSVDPVKYIDLAAEQVDSRLGYSYVVPLPIATLPDHQKFLLKSINYKLASGRLIMAIAVATEDPAVHGYAARLIAEADLELAAIVNGDVLLTAPRATDTGGVAPGTDPSLEDAFARIPGATNRDASSAVTAFEENIMQGDDSSWSPNAGRVYGFFDWETRRRAGG